MVLANQALFCCTDLAPIVDPLGAAAAVRCPMGLGLTTEQNPRPAKASSCFLLPGKCRMVQPSCRTSISKLCWIWINLKLCFFLKNIQSTWVSHSRRLAVHGAAREEDLRPRLRESLVVGISASLGHNRGPANCSGKHELSLLANQIAPPQILQCLSGTRSLATCNIRAAQEHVRSARNLQMTNWQRPRLPANWLLTLPDRPP